MFFVERHLDVVLEDPLVPEVLLKVGMNFFHINLLYYCLRLIYKEKKISTTMFFVKRHLDVVLEDPLVVGEKSLFYKIFR